MPGFAKGEAHMNKKTLLGLGLSVALTGAVAAPVITAAPVAAYAEDATVVSTETDLRNAVAKGGKIQLGNNISVTGEYGCIKIPAGTNVSLDLNGKTLTAWFLIDGSLTVSDPTAVQPTVNGTTVSGYSGGKIYSEGWERAANDWVGDIPVQVENGGVFTLESGMIETKYASGVSVIGNTNPTGSSNTSDVASTATIKGGYILSQEFGVNIRGRGAVLNASGGVVEAKDNAVLGGNGTDSSSAYCGGTTMNVTGGTYVGHIQSNGFIACGIYHPQSGTLNVSGGDFIIENGVGILMRGGDLSMTGGTITTMGDASGKVGDSRIISSCYGVFVDPSANYPSAKEAGISASVAGGTIKTDGANADSIAQSSPDNTSAKSVSATVTGGTFATLNNLIAASKFIPESAAVETSDGETFTVTAAEEAKSGASCLVNCEFTQDKTTSIYFKGENAQENAEEFVGGDDSGDKSYIQKADTSKVKVDIQYVLVNSDNLSGSDYKLVKSRELTSEELSAKKFTVSTSELPSVTRNGYVFAGWQANLDDNEGLDDVPDEGVTGMFDDSDLEVTDADGYVHFGTVFFASWYNDHVTVTFDTAGGSVLDSLDLDVNSDGEATLKKSDVATPTRAGYTFAGWVMDEYDEDSDTTAAKPVSFPKTLGATRNPEKIDTYTLRATWVKSGLVKFDANGGSAVEDLELTTDPTTGEACFSYGQLKNKVPTREGYTFVGWEDVDQKLDGTKAGTWKDGVVFGGEKDGDAAAVFAVTEDDCVLALKAVWKKDTTAPNNNTTNGGTTNGGTTNGGKTTTTTTIKTTAAKAKALPATGDNSVAAVAGIAATGAALVAAAATKRRNSTDA